MITFKKIEPAKAYQEVVEQIENNILLGRLKSGDKLPSERSLSEMLGASRRTIREAFRVLEQKGLIEIRRGSKGGAFVADRLQERMSETLTFLLRRETVTEAQVIEFRSAFEGTAAALAADRMTADDLKTLEAGIAGLAEISGRTPIDAEAFVKAEMDLHLLLADKSGNPIFYPIVKTTNDILLLPIFKRDPFDMAYMIKTINDWRAIHLAVKEGRADYVRELMENHVRSYGTAR